MQPDFLVLVREETKFCSSVRSVSRPKSAVGADPRANAWRASLYTVGTVLRGVFSVCGVRGVRGRPAMMRRRDGVTATLLESASRCRGVEGVREILSDARAGTFAGEFSFAAESGSRDTTVFAGVARAFLPRFVHGSSSSASSLISTSTASSSCAFCFFGVTNGFSFSASSKITKAVCRVARVEVLGVASAERVSFAFAEKRRQEFQWRLPGVVVRTALRVLFPRTVGAIVSGLREGGMGGVVCGKYGDL